MKKDDDIVIHCIVEGRVQGVFFRATTCDHAKATGVRGSVKNKSDGTVEVYAKGSREQIDAFLKRLEEMPGHGHVSNIKTTPLEENQDFEGFKVIY